MSRDETDRLAEMTADAVIVVNEKLKGQQRKPPRPSRAGSLE